MPVDVAELGDGAERPWLPAFEAAVDRARQLLPIESQFRVHTRLNGVFSMTADNQPLLGPIGNVDGLWAAEALWVTHAAGAAALLARQMTGDLREEDATVVDALRPDRFVGRAAGQLEREALRLYRDIYATVDNA